MGDVALVHDYLTQRGGAERVVLSLLSAFPGATVHTSLFDPETTFPEFETADVRTTSLQKVGAFRRNHRLALPALAWAFSRQVRPTAPVVVCSSSGWAHGAVVEGRKIVYCHTPARWLYQGDRYLGADGSSAVRAALRVMRPGLLRWDRTAASSADRYLVNSSAVRDRVREVYGIDAELLPPPHSAHPEGPQRPIDGIEPGFFLSVGRFLPYKHVDAVIAAFRELPQERLVVAGSGPQRQALEAVVAELPNVTLVNEVSDDSLRWLYANCQALVTASHEDFGLTPLEAASFGKPTAALRFGGFLDTIIEGETGVLFEEPRPADIADGVRRLLAERWDEAVLLRQADAYSESRFCERMRTIASEEARATNSR